MSSVAVDVVFSVMGGRKCGCGADNIVFWQPQTLALNFGRLIAQVVI